MCESGLAVAKFVSLHHQKLLTELAPDIVVAFGLEATKLHAGDNVVSVKSWSQLVLEQLTGPSCSL